MIDQKKIWRYSLIVVGFTLLFITSTLFFALTIYPNFREPSENIDVAEFLIEDGKPHPLVVLFGGSGGGNTWAKPHPKNTERIKSLQDLGFSVITIGYFGTSTTSRFLLDISLDQIMAEIDSVAARDAIQNKCVSLLGISRGGELVLLLSSLHESVNLVVSVVPSHVVWPALYPAFPQKSAWQHHGTPLVFLPSSTITWIKRVAFGFEDHEMAEALRDAVAEEKALIHVEDINGPILLISGKTDEEWPSYAMSRKVMDRLSEHEFQYESKHVAQDTGHDVFRDKSSWKEVLSFLNRHINKNGLCSN